MLWNGLRELPSTNFRIFVSVCLEVLFAAVVLFCMATDRKIAVDVVWAIGILITGWLGLGVAQFGWGRGTDRAYAAIKNAAAPTQTITGDAPTIQQINAEAIPTPQPAAPAPTVISLPPIIPSPTAVPPVPQSVSIDAHIGRAGTVSATWTRDD